METHEYANEQGKQGGNNPGFSINHERLSVLSKKNLK